MDGIIGAIIGGAAAGLLFTISRELERIRKALQSIAENQQLKP